MTDFLNDCCVLNSGSGAWAFEPLANQLSASLGVEVSNEARAFNYVLHVDQSDWPTEGTVFIPIESVRLAADKRLLAARFAEFDVPIPATRLLDSWDAVLDYVRRHSTYEWCLKYPTSCGGSGHRLISGESAEPPNWPRPFIVQEFVRLERPEVFRMYCAAGELFGWVARRFPVGSRASTWVAHARGARYVRIGDPPCEALEASRCALRAAGLLDSFGCVDLIQKPAGQWEVLEVGTDGLFNHVDRDLGDPGLEGELQRRVADAFWKLARNVVRR